MNLITHFFLPIVRQFLYRLSLWIYVPNQLEAKFSCSSENGLVLINFSWFLIRPFWISSSVHLKHHWNIKLNCEMWINLEISFGRNSCLCIGKSLTSWSWYFNSDFGSHVIQDFPFWSAVSGIGQELACLCWLLVWLSVVWKLKMLKYL